MARVSIYVPDELKARMDEVGDGVNWSEIVRPAIHSTIAEYQHRRSRNMQTAIERLRASKQEQVAEDEQSGVQDGRAWAESDASYRDLVRVSALPASAIEAEH